MHMPTVTVVCGLALLAVGLGFGLASGPAAPDASFMATYSKYIPAVFGGLLLVCGAAAFHPAARKHAVHLALVFALLGLLGAAGRLPKTLSGGTALAIASQTLMTLVCLGYLILGIRSFLAARRARKFNQTAAEA